MGMVAETDIDVFAIPSAEKGKGSPNRADGTAHAQEGESKHQGDESRARRSSFYDPLLRRGGKGEKKKEGLTEISHRGGREREGKI